jgi:hypothetical protein
MADMIRGIDRLVDAELDEAELARRLEDIKERADMDTRADRAPETARTPVAGGSVEIALEGALVAAFQLAAVLGVKLVVTRPSHFAHRQLWVTGLLGLFGSPTPGEAETQGATGSRRSETTS